MPTAKGDPGLTEKQFQRQVTDLASLCGWRWYHTHRSDRSPSGFPDLVLVHPKRGLVVFAEQMRGHWWGPLVPPGDGGAVVSDSDRGPATADGRTWKGV